MIVSFNFKANLIISMTECYTAETTSASLKTKIHPTKNLISCVVEELNEDIHHLIVKKLRAIKEIHTS